MPSIDPSHPLARLLAQDRRYSLEAYLFVLESLTFAQETLGLGQEPPVEEIEPAREEEREPGPTRSRTRPRRRGERHVSGQDLCEAARRYGLQQYGFLAPTVLATWGIRRTADIGEIVFNMIDIGQMRKTRSDKREDFHDVFAFDDGFARDIPFAVPDRV
ncbi:MAG: hypothetical protein FJ284_00850 [Planctomycetes bacterium]|nr:hypothetical protein [Planctomycetota bacterium]